MADVQIEGLAALEQEFNQMLSQIGPVSAEGMTDVVLDLTGRAVALAPVKDGGLRGAGKGDVNGATIATGNKDGTISVTGSAPASVESTGEVGFYGLPYIREQHERLDFNHPKGGQAKFLEQPFEENSQRYIKHIADKSKKIWGG